MKMPDNLWKGASVSEFAVKGRWNLGLLLEWLLFDLVLTIHALSLPMDSFRKDILKWNERNSSLFIVKNAYNMINGHAG